MGIFIKIPPASSLEEAQKIADAADEICLISKATSGNIEVNERVVEYPLN